MPDETQPDILSLLMPQDADQATAMLAALQKQQGEQQARQAELRTRLGQQNSQAGNLRNLAMLTSLGANPLLQGLNRTAGAQAEQMGGEAQRTEGLLGQAKAGMLDPMRIATLQQAAERLRLAKEAAENKVKNDAARLNLKETEAKRKAAAAAAKATAKTATDAEKKTQGNIKLAGNLRKEFQALPAYKNFQIASVAQEQMEAAAKDQTPAGRITLITTFMKSIDPATGVKDQEFNNAQNAGGWATRAQAALEKAMNGTLTQEQAMDFVKAGRNNLKALKSTHDSALKRYQGLATTYNVAPEQVATPASDFSLEEPPPSAPPPASPTGVVGPGDPRSVKEIRPIKTGPHAGKELVIFGDNHGEIRTPKVGK